MSARTFEWDPAKARANARKHGLSFSDVRLVFRGHTSNEPETSVDYGEERWLAVGLLKLAVVAIVYTVPQENTYRIISMRPATNHEQQQFWRDYPQ